MTTADGGRFTVTEVLPDAAAPVKSVTENETV